MDVPVDAVDESLARRWEALRPHLNERQRRLWLGAEARELGSGGAARVAVALGVAADTVRRGRAELDNPEATPQGRSRKAGGGSQAGRGESAGPGAGTGRAGRTGHPRGPRVAAAVDDEVAA